VSGKIVNPGLRPDSVSRECFKVGFRPTGRVIIVAAVSAVGVAACGGGNDTSPEEVFAQRLVGKYERVSPVPAPGGATAYLRQTVTLERSSSGAVVTQGLTTEAFFDQALTQRVLKYDSKGPCKVVRPSSIPTGFEVDCTNDTSILTAFVTDPGLMSGLGLDDCNLEAGVPKDVSNGCAAPTFLVSACVDQDVFALSADGRRFSWGDQAQDRCVRRSTELEPSTFARVL